MSLKMNTRVTAILRQANGMFRDLTEKNGFNFIGNDVIPSGYLRKDCVHLQHMVTHVLSNIFKKFHGIIEY